MNNALVTTGLLPLTVRSVEQFTVQAYKDQLPWSLVGGQALLKLTDPDGNPYTYTATISGSTASYTWQVANITGNWVRAWELTDSSGIVQVSRPIVFTVVSSPS